MNHVHNFDGFLNEANISFYKSTVVAALRELGYNVKQADLKIGANKKGNYDLITLNGELLCSSSQYDEMVKWIKNAVTEDPKKYGLDPRVLESEITEQNVKPNNKLKSETGYPYAMFYLSTQAANIMIDFANPGHIELIKLLADQSKIMDDKGELSPSDTQKGSRLFKKILNQTVSYSKYSGADCSYRLSKTSDADITRGDGNTKWYDDNQKMATLI